MIKILENGVKIVYEKNDTVRSTVIGIWVSCGSRYENDITNGISHFAEHMMFKGTKNRTAKQISYDIDRIGGQMNAFTTKETTCYYIKSLDIHFDKALDIITDMFFNSNFDQNEIDLERNVIEEEIAMYENEPEDLVIETITEIVYGNSKYSRPVLGTRESLKEINHDTLVDFVNNNYTSENTVVSIVGNFTQSQFDKICEIFSVMKSSESMLKTDESIYLPTNAFIEKDITQNHICLGFESLSKTHEKRFALQILNSILGGSGSSRLFQKVREENGLCYSVSSFNMSTLETGLFIIYVALSKKTEQRAMELIREVIVDFCENGVTDEEFDIAREQIKASIIMGLEGNLSKMHFIARSVINHGEVTTEDQIIKRYDSVTKEDVVNLAKSIFSFEKMSICAIGDITNDKIYKL